MNFRRVLQNVTTVQIHFAVVSAGRLRWLQSQRFGEKGRLFQNVSILQCNLSVRAMSACSDTDIILDSGSDVTLIPMGLAGLGTQAPAQPEMLKENALQHMMSSFLSVQQMAVL